MTGQLHECSLPFVKVYFSGSVSFTAELVKNLYCLKKLPSEILRVPVCIQRQALPNCRTLSGAGSS